MALARVGGDEELLKEIAVLFLDEYPRSLGELHKAVEAGDSKAVERAAHSIKGAVSNFGARAAVDAAAQLEQLGRAQKLAGASLGLHSLEQALTALSQELSSL